MDIDQLITDAESEIATMERPSRANGQQMLALIKEMRDDLQAFAERSDYLSVQGKPISQIDIRLGKLTDKWRK